MPSVLKGDQFDLCDFPKPFPEMTVLYIDNSQTRRMELSKSINLVETQDTSLTNKHYQTENAKIATFNRTANVPRITCTSRQ